MNPAIVSSELEARWIRLAQAGDQQAFAELAGIYWKGVAGMVYRMCGDMHLAEDVTQDTFIRAWKNLPAFEPQKSLRNWLYRIAANRMIDIIRREKPAEDIEMIEIADAVKPVETQVILNEKLQKVQSAVLSLPMTLRSVLILREYEGLAYKEISETLNIPLGTVMSRLNQARQKLLEMLKGEMESI